MPEKKAEKSSTMIVPIMICDSNVLNMLIVRSFCLVCYTAVIFISFFLKKWECLVCLLQVVQM